MTKSEPTKLENLTSAFASVQQKSRSNYIKYKKATQQPSRMSDKQTRADNFIEQIAVNNKLTKFEDDIVEQICLATNKSNTIKQTLDQLREIRTNIQWFYQSLNIAQTNSQSYNTVCKLILSIEFKQIEQALQQIVKNKSARKSND